MLAQQPAEAGDRRRDAGEAPAGATALLDRVLYKAATKMIREPLSGGRLKLPHSGTDGSQTRRREMDPDCELCKRLGDEVIRRRGEPSIQ